MVIAGAKARLLLQGCSSAGRASVSKTEGHGFESCHPCQGRFQHDIRELNVCYMRCVEAAHAPESPFLNRSNPIFSGTGKVVRAFLAADGLFKEDDYVEPYLSQQPP